MLKVTIYPIHFLAGIRFSGNKYSSSGLNMCILITSLGNATIFNGKRAISLIVAKIRNYENSLVLSMIHEDRSNR